MKFIVRQHPFDKEKVEVRLATETKDKIKKVLYWGSIAGSSIYLFVTIRNDYKNKEDPENK